MPSAYGPQLGRLFLLKIADLTSPSNYVTIGGLKATSGSIGNEKVDITTKDEAPWQALMANCGIRSVQISGSGVCKDDSAFNYLRTFSTTGAAFNGELTNQSGDTVTGSFLVSKLEYTGAHNGAMEYSISLDSTGTVVVTPHA